MGRLFSTHWKKESQRRATNMKIKSKIENSNYTQWIIGFVQSVINQADLKCDEVVIDENVYADAEVIYKQAVNVVDICKSLMDNNEEEFADFPKRDAFRRWRRS